MFRESRLRNEAALLDEERELSKRRQQVVERRRLIIRDLRAEGNAAYLAYDFATALKRFQRARNRTDRTANPESWADLTMDVAKANWEIGIRTQGTAVHEHLAEAVATYRQALQVYTREQLPQQWAATQNNLGNALSNQGTRTGGEDGRRLLAEARAAFQGALSIYRAARASHYVGIVERNLARTDVLLADENDPDVQLARGLLYAQGDGVTQDDAKAVAWFSKAAAQSHGQAQLFLGVMALSGRGAEQDLVSAYAWVHLSAENGSKEAVQLRGQLRQEMEPDQLEAAEKLAWER